MKEFIIKNKVKITFFIILFIAILVRIYKITNIPTGINVDEAGLSYDAYTLANFGVDRYLNPYPLYLVNFGAGQSVLYAYFASFLIKIFGYSLFIVRLPAFILSITTVIISYFIGKNISKKYGLLLMFLVTITPWHIMQSRWALDCNLLTPIAILSIYSLIKAKTPTNYIVTGILFGLTLYTYALSYLILPLFLLLTVSYMLYTKKISIKEVIILAIPIFILALPLFLMILINNGYLSEIKNIITIPKLWYERTSEISFSLKRVISNLSFFKTMFTTDYLNYNSIKEFGTLYYISIPLSLMGFILEIIKLIKSIKEKNFNQNSLFLILFISGITLTLFTNYPNINRANIIFIPLIYFIATTLKYIYDKKKIITYIIIPIYIIFFISFSYFYFNKYPNKYKHLTYFENSLIESIKYVETNYKDNNIYIYTTSQEPYIYTLIINKKSPYDFNKEIHNKKTFSYSKYYINEDIVLDDNNIYIVKNDMDIKNTLKENNYKEKNIDNYIIFYK